MSDLQKLLKAVKILLETEEDYGIGGEYSEHEIASSELSELVEEIEAKEDAKGELLESLGKLIKGIDLRSRGRLKGVSPFVSHVDEARAIIAKNKEVSS
jgi:hypothetical protein